MVGLSLFFVRIFRKLIQLWGVDYDQFETLLRNNLILDFRRSPSRHKSSKKQKNPFVKQLVIFAFMGGFVEFSLYSIHDIFLNLTILYAIIMVMLGTTLINEFTSVLFDERENDILLARPISHRTLFLARIMHIQFYVGYIALALSLLSGIVLAVKYHLVIMLAYFAGVGLSAWMTLLFTIFFYLALSKFVKGNRFKDFVTYVQIFLAVVIFGGYQLLPQVVDTGTMKNMYMSVRWWTYLIPPAWPAGFVKFFTFTDTAGMAPFFVLALAVPFFGAIVVVRYLSKGFGDILGRGTVGENVHAKKISWKGEFPEKLGRLFCVTDMERVGWKITMKMTRRDRKFKQAVYPMLGIIPVMAIIMLKPDFSNLSGSIHKMGDTYRYLYFIFLGFFGTMGILQLPYTDTPEASWIYKALPFNRHGHIISGAVKALLYKIFFPVYSLLILFSLLIWNIHIFPEMLLGGLLTVFVTLLMVIFQKMGLPFTQAREMQQKGGSVLKMFLGIFLMGLVVLLVYLSSFLPGWGVLFLSASVAGMIMLANRSVRFEKFTV